MMKSISTGDLLDASGSADWLLKCAAPDAMERRVLLGGGLTSADDYCFTVRHNQHATEFSFVMSNKYYY